MTNINRKIEEIKNVTLLIMLNVSFTNFRSYKSNVSLIIDCNLNITCLCIVIFSSVKPPLIKLKFSENAI